MLNGCWGAGHRVHAHAPRCLVDVVKLGRECARYSGCEAHLPRLGGGHVLAPRLEIDCAAFTDDVDRAGDTLNQPVVATDPLPENVSRPIGSELVRDFSAAFSWQQRQPESLPAVKHDAH